ncbi:MAG: cobalamin biosynthesis protein [Fervidobacterium sp.]
MTENRKIAFVVISKNGLKMARFLTKLLGGDIFCLNKYKEDDCIGFEKVPEITQNIFKKYNAIVYIMATGIVVRSISNLINNKFLDPAVIVVDDAGKFVISLLSGHFGGANELTIHISNFLNAIPVVTTATDVHNKFSIDNYMKKYFMLPNDYKELKLFSVKILKGEKLNIYIEEQLSEFSFVREIINQIPHACFHFNYLSNINYDLLITFKDNLFGSVILYPKILHVGIGFSTKVNSSDLLFAVEESFKKYNLSIKSLKSVSSLERKIQTKVFEDFYKKLCSYTFVQKNSFCVEKLKAHEDKFQGSDFVKGAVGVGAVAKPCAYLSSKKGIEIFYEKMKGVTISTFIENPKGDD